MSLDFWPGSVEEKPKPDPSAVQQLWRSGMPAKQIAERLGCDLGAVAELLERLEAGQD